MVRLYYDMDGRDPLMAELCRIACTDNNIALCNVKELPGLPAVDASAVFAMNWRFFPTLDPQVNQLELRV